MTFTSEQPPATVAGHEWSFNPARALAVALGAAALFQLAWTFPSLKCLVLPYAFGLILLGRAASAKLAFRSGFLCGILIFAPQLFWFWKIFGPAALCLWAILSFFHGLLVLLLFAWRTRFGSRFIWLAAPILWTGIEYFRSELYYLRFSWLTVGYTFSGSSGLFPSGLLGVYGIGFVLFLIAAVIGRAKRPAAFLGVATGMLAILLNYNDKRGKLPARQTQPLRVAGIQLEFPPDLAIPAYLDRVIERYPDCDLIVLCEYTFDGPVPQRVREWCQRHRKYFIAGGKDEAAQTGEFYNTAFVVGPHGDIVFKQAKSVPIQFFKDGLPAPAHNVWESPWGKLGICICYDLSYRRVVDRYARAGARALIVPFMDVTEWGKHQHELHARIGALRAEEYNIPIFRVGSSGISQLFDAKGHLRTEAPFPGEEQILGGEMLLAGAARLPLDTHLAPFCSALTGLFAFWMLLGPLSGRGTTHGRGFPNGAFDRG